MSLDGVSREELPSVIEQLKEALATHQQWHDSLVRALVCKLPSNKADTTPLAHTECRFGKWYYGKASEKLHKDPGFLAMGEEHVRMHRLAAQLLVSADSGQSISVTDYDSFANSLGRLRLEMIALEQKLEDSLFNHDALTGALVRTSLLSTLRDQQELAKRRVQFSYIAMMDLDHFKAINDLHGHQAGDAILSASIRYLIKNLRPYDKVFRYGGEEFLLCMPYADSAPAIHERVDRLRQEISALEIDIGKATPVHIRVSFGVALLDPDLPVETSIDRADKALYVAKSEGRNCVRMWNPAMKNSQ